MAEVERHLSPDGKFSLVVDESDGDLAVGFDGYSWHTHGHLLVPDFGSNPSEAMRHFVDAILRDDLALAVTVLGGRITDVEVTLDPRPDLEDAAPGPQVMIRYWGGSSATA